MACTLAVGEIKFYKRSFWTMLLTNQGLRSIFDRAVVTYTLCFQWRFQQQFETEIITLLLAKILPPAAHQLRPFLGHQYRACNKRKYKGTIIECQVEECVFVELRRRLLQQQQQQQQQDLPCDAEPSWLSWLSFSYQMGGTESFIWWPESRMKHCRLKRSGNYSGVVFFNNSNICHRI